MLCDGTYMYCYCGENIFYVFLSKKCACLCYEQCSSIASLTIIYTSFSWFQIIIFFIWHRAMCGLISNCDGTEVFDCPHNEWIYGLLLCRIRIERQQKKRTLCVIVTKWVFVYACMSERGWEWASKSEWWNEWRMNTLFMLINVRPFCVCYTHPVKIIRTHTYKYVYYTFDCWKIMRKQTQCNTNEASFWWSQRKTRAFVVKEMLTFTQTHAHTLCFVHTY